MLFYEKGEEGSVMLFTVMLILVTTVVGLVATQTSLFEIKISENNRRYSEEFDAAEAALNHAIANFRLLKDDLSKPPSATNSIEISKVLNDNTYTSFKDVFYRKESEPTYPSGSNSLALIEVRRIDPSSDDVSGLSSQANDVPQNTHRYYAGSIDRRRFAITATAYRRESTTLSSTWVQKGISLPAEQNKDLF